MKTINKRLLTSAGLFLALFALSSFNPLNHYYNSETGSAQLSELSDRAENNLRDTNNALAKATDSSSRSRGGRDFDLKTACNNLPKNAPPEAKKNCQNQTSKPAKSAQEDHVFHKSDSDRFKCSDNFNDNYLKDKNSITIKSNACDESAISFSSDNGDLIVVEAIKKTHEGGRFDDGGNKVEVTYRVVTDSKRETEAGVCKSCLADLRRSKTIEVDSIDLNQIEGEFNSGGDNIASLKNAIKRDLGIRLDTLKEDAQRHEQESCQEGDFNDRYNCFKDRLAGVKKNSKEYKEIMDDLGDFVKEAAMDDDIRPSRLNKLKRLAKGDREITLDIDAALRYKDLNKRQVAYQKRIDSYTKDINNIGQQLSMMNCDGINAQVNFYCNTLFIQRQNTIYQLQTDIAGFQHLVRNTFPSNSKSDLVSDLRENLASSYEDMVSNYSDFVTDPSLQSLDANLVVPAANLNNNINRMAMNYQQPQQMQQPQLQPYQPQYMNSNPVYNQYQQPNNQYGPYGYQQQQPNFRPANNGYAQAQPNAWSSWRPQNPAPAYNTQPQYRTY